MVMDRQVTKLQEQIEAMKNQLLEQKAQMDEQTKKLLQTLKINKKLMLLCDSFCNT